MKILHLVLIAKWYDMQFSGVKTEEYRAINEYWCKRLFKWVCPGISRSTCTGYCYFVDGCYLSNIATPYTHVCFHRGYTNVTFLHKIDSISVGYGRVEWGAPKGQRVIIIKHSQVL